MLSVGVTVLSQFSSASTGTYNDIAIDDLPISAGRLMTCPALL
jgi:hypothetical protein